MKHTQTYLCFPVKRIYVCPLAFDGSAKPAADKLELGIDGLWQSVFFMLEKDHDKGEKHVRRPLTQSNNQTYTERTKATIKHIQCTYIVAVFRWRCNIQRTHTKISLFVWPGCQWAQVKCLLLLEKQCGKINEAYRRHSSTQSNNQTHTTYLRWHNNQTHSMYVRTLLLCIAFFGRWRCSVGG